LHLGGSRNDPDSGGGRDSLALHQNRPNPFNPTTTISFVLPGKARVDLSVYNLQGQLVRTLVNEVLDEGLSEVIWNGTDARGNPVASGVYFYRLRAGKSVMTKKMILLK
jgi:flagellar hook assembly protein FlgD